jgi:hypothetical protein
MYPTVGCGQAQAELEWATLKASLCRSLLSPYISTAKVNRLQPLRARASSIFVKFDKIRSFWSFKGL